MMISALGLDHCMNTSAISQKKGMAAGQTTNIDIETPKAIDSSLPQCEILGKFLKDLAKFMNSIEGSEKINLKTDSFDLIADSNNNNTNSHWLFDLREALLA